MDTKSVMTQEEYERLLNDDSYEQRLQNERPLYWAIFNVPVDKLVLEQSDLNVMRKVFQQSDLKGVIRKAGADASESKK